MSTCAKCHSDVSVDAVECPRCGVILAKVRGDQPSQDVSPAPRIPAKYFVLALLIGGACLWHLRPPMSMPEIADKALVRLQSAREPAEVSDADPCQDRTYCLYLYVAPWCPACHEFLPHVPEIRKFWQDGSRPGLKVIVGWDKEPALDEMAAQIGPPIFADESAIFRKSLKFRGVPYFMVVNQRHQIIAQGSAALAWLNGEINAHSP